MIVTYDPKFKIAHNLEVMESKNFKNSKNVSISQNFKSRYQM
jgi:hypothetical protein